MKNPFIRYFLLLLLGVGLATAYPSSGTLNLTGAYNFVGPFDVGYGGEFAGNIVDSTTMTSQYIDVFCVDFAHDVYIPSSHTVNLTPLPTGTQVTAQFANDTQSGDVTNWVALPAGGTLTQGELNAINGASALQRYQMAAYLVSNYTFFNQGAPKQQNIYSDTRNLGIQTAIWSILDPSGFSAPSLEGDAVHWLSQASDWLTNSNSQAKQQVLSRFWVVSDTEIARGDHAGAIQEFLGASPVPEPSFYIVLTAGLAILFWAVRRKRQAV